jgi:hypothetical protein
MQNLRLNSDFFFGLVSHCTPWHANGGKRVFMVQLLKAIVVYIMYRLLILIANNSWIFITRGLSVNVFSILLLNSQAFFHRAIGFLSKATGLCMYNVRSLQ